jgi:tetratricopeptide (TPR) repeat protein
MSRASLRFLSLLLIFLAMSPSLKAQRPGTGRSSGGVIDVQIRYATGEPGPGGIHVRLESAQGGAAGDCQTRDGGKCQFNLSSSGVYLVRMTERGYKEAIVRVELIGTSRGYASLELIPVAAKVKPEAVANVPAGTSGNSVSTMDLSVPDNARQEYTKGESALKENKLDSSVDHFRKAIRFYGEFPQAYRMLGTIYLQQKNWKDAQIALEKAIQLDSKLGDAYLELGAVFNQTKDYPKAEAALTRGLELNPDAPGGHYELAKTYWATGRWQDAAPHAATAVSEFPSLAAPHVLLGNILLRKNDPHGALREYEEYLRLDSHGPMAPGTREMVAKIQKALEEK